MIEQAEQLSEQRFWHRSSGLNIVSAFPLDDLAVTVAPTRPDLSIERIGASAADDFAAASEHVVSVGEVGAPWLEVRRGPGGFLARWPEEMDVIIPDDGRRMLVFERGELADSIPRVLLCQAMSFVLAAHGREGLHASAVEIDGRAVVLSGRSGAGKSTIAAALCRAGGRLLTDDLAAVRLADDGTPVVEAHSTKTWLMREVAAEMFGAEAGEEHNRIHKVAVGPTGMIAGAAEAVPVGAVYLLGFHAHEPAILGPISGKKALGSLLGALFNFVVRNPERLALQFRIAGELIDRVPIFELRWQAGPRSAEQVAEQILERLAHPQEEGSSMADATIVAASNGHANGHVNGSLNGGASSNGAASKDGAARAMVIERLRAAGLDEIPDDPDEPLLRTSQVAALLRSSDRTIRTWADAGKLPYIKTLGGRRLFPASAVLAVMHEMRRDLQEEA